MSAKDDRYAIDLDSARDVGESSRLSLIDAGRAVVLALSRLAAIHLKKSRNVS